MKNFSVIEYEIKMRKWGVSLMNVRTVKVVIEIVEVCYEVGVFTVRCLEIALLRGSECSESRVAIFLFVLPM